MESLSSVGVNTPLYTNSANYKNNGDTNDNEQTTLANADSSIFNFNGAGSDTTVNSFQA